ncbi:MAG: hypothetical protein HBSAPP01_06090 [Candidatus Brocadia sapporoensis]|nr:MAG: hypothetical protein HBSAPP01_06090 [Candidatus Brocadia sapporoensis]
MTIKRKRVFGDKINFKTLATAPVNELGVVYLFGVLHDTFDFKIESIQSGYPDCIARRKVARNRWQEVRIEFEYDSKSFLVHGHDADNVDVIVCWTHNWKGCPKKIEVIELSSLLGIAEQIDDQIKTKRQLTAWQKFAQEKRLEGLDFREIAKLWKVQKNK